MNRISTLLMNKEHFFYLKHSDALAVRHLLIEYEQNYQH